MLGLMGAVGNATFTAVCGGSAEEITKAFGVGFIAGLGAGALVCGLVMINVLAIAEAGAFLAAAAFGASLANVVLLSVLTVYSVASGNEQKLMTYVSLLSTALMGLCVTYGAYGEVTVSGDKGSKTISTEDVSKAGGSDSNFTRVGRWMSEDEYNKIHVANPAEINAFSKQAPKGFVYVEFDVPNDTIFPGGRDGWGIIAGPGSLYDRLAIKKGLPAITEMPQAINIEIKGRK